MSEQTLVKRVTLKHSLRSISLGLFLSALGLLGVLMLTGGHANATTNSDINFQARLLNSSGAIVPDGNYNVEFKL